MGFYKRRAISFGPVRFNLSKAGIGVSIATKEGHLAAERGRTIVQIGRQGLSYRERLDAAGPATSSFDADLHAPDTAGAAGSRGIGLVVSSSREVLSHLNSRASRTAHAPFIIAISIIALPVCAFFDTLAAVWVFGVGAGLAWLFYNGDKDKRTSDLVYQLADESGKQFALMQSAFETLAKSIQIWLVQQNASTPNRNKGAGGAGRIVRTPVRVRRARPPWINTNVRIASIDLGTNQLFFFPDRLLVWDSRKYRAVSYDALGVAFAPTRFIEDGRPPRDSEIVDHAWRYAGESGEPDLRYTSNKQLPVVNYGSVIFGAHNQLIAHLHVSNPDCAAKFAEVFRASVRLTKAANAPGAADAPAAEPEIKRPPTAERARAASRGARIQGRVKWFDVEKGYGFITAQSGQQVIVLLPQLLADGLRSLPEGCAVEFQVVRGAQGPMAVNVTTLAKEEGQSGARRTNSQPMNERGPLLNPWEVLGVRVGSREDEVIAAYRRMAQMYHPDKVANLGPEFKELADRKMREINAAYEALKVR